MVRLFLYFVSKWFELLDRFDAAPSIGEIRDLDPEDWCGDCDCFECETGGCCIDCNCMECCGCDDGKCCADDFDDCNCENCLDNPDVNFLHPDNDWPLEETENGSGNDDDDDDWNNQLRFTI